MNRARFAVAATVVTATFAAAVLVAGQGAQAPPMKSVLAGKKFLAPVRGEALVEYTAPVTRREKDMVVTRIIIKNTSKAPIGRLTFNETWYDKAGAIVVGGKGVIEGLLQPGEIKALVVETPYRAGMQGNRQNFTHANGTVKATRVPKLEVPKQPATAPAATTK